MIDPTTVRYDGQLAASICCTDIGGVITVPLALGESFCPGQPVSLDSNGDAIHGTSNFVGLSESQNPVVDVAYVNLGGVACAGIPVFGDGDDIFTGKELAPSNTFQLTQGAPSSGTMTFGEHEYVITYVQSNCNGTHESLASNAEAISLTQNFSSVDFTNIPIGIYDDTIERKIYKRKITPPTFIDYAVSGTVSGSSESIGFPVTNTNDGNSSTYWINDLSQPISTTDMVYNLDIGSLEVIDRTQLTWFVSGFISDYIIETSPDNLTWTQQGLAYTGGFGTGIIVTLFSAPVVARYVRITFISGTSADINYVAILDIQVQGQLFSPTPVFELYHIITDNITTTYSALDEVSILPIENPPTVSDMEFSLTNVSRLNFPVGTYDLGTGCITIPLREDGCIAQSCLKKTSDMVDGEFAVQIDSCSWNMFDVTLDNPAIPRQLKHWDSRGSSRKVRRLITFDGVITHNGESGKLKGINALNGVWRTAATPTIKKDGFYLLEWIGSDGEKYSTQAQLFGNKPIINISGSNKFSTQYTVELVSEGEIFAGDPIMQTVEEGHISGMDIGGGAVSISQTGLSDIENPTIIDLTSFCNRDSEIPINVHISWTGLQDQAELPPNTGDNALGTYLTNYIIFANADAGTAIKFNVNFKRTDTIDIDKNGIVFYNGAENPTIVDSIISIPPTLISGEVNTLVLTDASHWGENAHGKLIQAEISYSKVI